MAKTRAERKKEKERALRQGEQKAKTQTPEKPVEQGESVVVSAADDASVGVPASSGEKKNTSKKTGETDAVSNSSKQKSEKSADAVSASSKPAQDIAVKDERKAAKEAKERQRIIERDKKVTAKAEAKRKKGPRRGPKFIWTFINYIKNVKLELKRVVWPGRDEVVRMSVVVIVALAFFGVFIYLIDSGITPLLYMLSGIGG